MPTAARAAAPAGCARSTSPGPTKFTTDQERRIRRAMDTFIERCRHAPGRRAPHRDRARGHRRRAVHVDQRVRAAPRPLRPHPDRHGAAQGPDAAERRAAGRPGGAGADARRPARHRVARPRADRHRPDGRPADVRHDRRGALVGLVRRLRDDPGDRRGRHPGRDGAGRRRLGADARAHARSAPGRPVLDDGAADPLRGDRARRLGVLAPRRGGRPRATRSSPRPSTRASATSRSRCAPRSPTRS